MTEHNEESYTNGNKCWYCKVMLSSPQEFSRHMVENHADKPVMLSHSKRLAEDAYS